MSNTFLAHEGVVIQVWRNATPANVRNAASLTGSLHQTTEPVVAGQLWDGQRLVNPPPPPEPPSRSRKELFDSFIESSGLTVEEFLSELNTRNPRS